MNEQPSRRLRVFISQPMNGKANEEIVKEREELTEFAKAKLGSDVEIIDSYFKDAPHDAKPLWFLGKSFELLSTADACVFAKGYEKARGCVMEHKACENYGIKAFEYGNPVQQGNIRDDDIIKQDGCELSKEQADKEIAEIRRQRDFDELSEVAERFINKWGCHHSAVIIRQGSIELFEGTMVSPLKILD